MSQIPTDLEAELDREMRRSRDVFLPINIDITSALAIVGNLQLALRHPSNVGQSAKIARNLINGIIASMQEAGLPAHVKLARLGDDPNFDYLPSLNRKN